MVRFTLTLATVVAAVVFTGYLLYLNPESVELRLSATTFWQAPLALIILASFVVGVLCAMTVSLTSQSRNALRAWRKRRAENRERRRQERKEQAVGLIWLGEHDKARSLLAKALQAAPQDMSAFLLFAKSYLSEKNFKRARAVLQEGLDSRGGDVRLLYLLGRAHRGLGDLTAAADAWERARQAAPKSNTLREELRDVYIAQKRWDDAISLQEECLLAARRPEDYASAEALLIGLRLEAALAQKNPRDAEARLRAIVRKKPDFEPAQVSLGELLMASGRQRAAERIWKRAMRRFPRGGVIERLEAATEKSSRLRRLDSLYRRLLARREDDGGLRLFYVRYLLKTGKPDQAQGELRKLPPHWQASPAARLLEAEMLAERGETAQAAKEMGQVLTSSTIAPFRCGRCGQAAEKWQARCHGCLEWGTMRSFVEWQP